MADITDQEIQDRAKDPKSASTEDGSVTERSVDEMITAQKHASAQSIGSSPLHGLRISRCKPAGPV